MVDKAGLLKAVWPDVFVEEGALTRTVSLIRKSMTDLGHDPGCIETIPKRGYRFITPVRVLPLESEAAESAVPPPVSQDASPCSPVAGPTTFRSRTSLLLISAGLAGFLAVVVALAYWKRGTIPTRSSTSPFPVSVTALAVLPFRSMATDSSQDYFVEGMTHSLITSLSRISGLRIVSLASDMGGGRRNAGEVDAILRGQDVSRILTGAVMQSGNRIRIDAQLIDPKTRAVSWANSFEYATTDLLKLEATVAEAIADQVQVAVSTEERLRLQKSRKIVPDALDAYLRGRYLWERRTETSLKRSVQYFQQSIAADPGYASAYCGLADAYAMLGSSGVDALPPKFAMPLAKAAALKAIELDPALGDAHASLAYVKLSYDWDFRGAEREFAQALALQPGSANAHHWYSHYFMAVGNLREATRQMELAWQLEPLSPSINMGIGWCLYYGRQYDKAAEKYRSLTEMEPGYPLAFQTLAMAYQERRMYPEAIQAFERATVLSGNSPTSLAGLASAYAVAGRKADALRILFLMKEMAGKRYVPALHFASVHHALGDTPKALGFAWAALGERTDYLIYLHMEPRAGDLMNSPGLITFLGAIRGAGLPDFQPAHRN